MNQTKELPKKIFNLTVLVAGLGYFVDIYDLQLFNLVSKASLKGIGIVDQVLIDKYDYTLFLYQMAGMLVGGLLWGFLGDRKGRKSIMFGSILLYSIANICNGFVYDINTYSAVRFLAGLGLAGELGAAVTLVSETIHKEHRGWGTMMIVTLGALGAVAANLIVHEFSWQNSYFIGGGLGLCLLLLRVGTFESGMFDAVKNSDVSKGNFFNLFKNKKRLLTYLSCIGVGLPVWFCVGILIKFSASIATATHVVGGNVDVRNAIMYSYLGLSFGDLICGALSQLLRSRRKVVLGYLTATIVLVSVYLFRTDISLSLFYFMCFMIGSATGYWALFVTIASEQFGTNIRATVTTTVPNFVRGAVIPITLSFKALEKTQGTIHSALIVGSVCISIAFISILYLQETFAKDLDYIESE